MQTFNTVLPLIIPAGIIIFLFPAGIIGGRELLEVLKMYLFLQLPVHLYD